MLLKRRTVTSSNVAEGRLNQKDPWKTAEYEDEYPLYTDEKQVSSELV